MGIRHPLISEIAKDTYLFNEFGLCNHYLLVGTERALLIDCGMGYYDLRATVERMTDKELGKKSMASLIAAGAFDAMGKNRAQLLEVYESGHDAPVRARLHERKGPAPAPLGRAHGL